MSLLTSNFVIQTPSKRLLESSLLESSSRRLSVSEEFYYSFQDYQMHWVQEVIYLFHFYCMFGYNVFLGSDMKGEFLL